MVHLSVLPAPEVQGIDLAFRPESYFVALDSHVALPSSILGKARRDLVRKMMADGRPIPHGLDVPVLDPELREAWGRMHPMNMGGEYLEPPRENEVEIARVSLASTTGDQISVRARRSATKISYSIVDEYPDQGTVYDLHPRTSQAPLTMRDLVAMLDGATDQGGVVMSCVLAQVELGDDASDYEGFVSVESDFYPDLGRYYAVRLQNLSRSA